MSRHINIPIFIPHLGCPNQCVFCNQRVISGRSEFDPTTLRSVIDEALSSVEPGAEVEIAFFGGSFTGIDFSLMTELLKTAYSYIEDGRVGSVRCSTRPDYINEKILDTLWKYGVRTIELGLQSSDDGVLKSAKRGHTRLDELSACKMIKEYGFSLVGQMMIGLPGSTPHSEIETAKFIVDMGADGARIYPTVVFVGTELADMTARGCYEPLTDTEAAERSAEAFAIFAAAGVSVIRIGLQSGENLASDKTYVGGPNHSAMGELVVGEYYYRKIRDTLVAGEDYRDTVLRVLVSRGSISKAVGQNKRNKRRLMSEFGFSHVLFSESPTLRKYEVVAQKERIKDVFKDT